MDDKEMQDLRGQLKERLKGEVKINPGTIAHAKIRDLDYTPANYYHRPELRNVPGEELYIRPEEGGETRHVKRSIESFKKTIIDQEKKGIEKYGQPLKPIAIEYDWLKMAEEELVDGFQYLVAEQEKREFVAKKIRSLIQDTPENIRSEIDYWLVVLEGK